MSCGNFPGEQHPQQVQVCWCGGASFQDIRVMFREELDAFKRSLLPHLRWENDSHPPAISRSLAHQAETSPSKRLFLRINDESLPETLYTLNKIKDHGGSLTVELLDDSGYIVEDGPESSAKIRFAVVNGDFEVEDNDWTDEDVDKNIVQPRKDKPPLLRGRCEVSLIGGVASVGDFCFTDNSKRSGSVRLAAQVVKSPPGVVIRAAVSRDFTVKERRGLRDQKLERPSLGDKLWCLKNISRGGRYYERAKKAGICTVKDFLQLYHTDPEKMRNILEVNSEAKWKEIVENAEACELGSGLYSHYDDTTKAEIQLDCAFNILSVSFGGQTIQSLNDNQKHIANKLRYAAYEKRSEFETNSSIDQMQMQASCSSSLPSMTMDLINVPAAQQGIPVQHENSNMAGPLSVSCHFENGGGGPEIHGGLHLVDNESFDDLLNMPITEWEKLLKFSDIPLNSPIGSKPTNKFIAAYYVTKAANIFMISIQQDQGPRNKKRKLQ